MCGSIPTPPPIPPLPPPPAPLPAPTIDEAKQKRMNQDELLSRKGRAASILTGSSGDLTAPETGTKKLLGG